MNPFAAFQTVSKPLVARFAARPVLILFVLCLVLGLAAVVWRAKARADAGRAHARIAAQARGAAVELQLSQALTAAEVLGALARQSGGGISNFQTVALELLASRPGLASLELQPGGVVSDIVPRAGHERAIGFNVLKDAAHRPGAYAAIQRRVLTVTGPLTIDHGEPGIVVRVPVFQRGRDGRDYFWGFVAVSMRLPEALARARVDELSTQGYHYAFFAPGSAQQKGVTIAARGALSLQDAVQQPVRAQNLEFRLALRPRGGWVNATKVALEALGVLVVSGLLCLLANLLQSRRLAFETAEPGQTQKDRSGAKAGAAAAQAEFTLAELQERLEGTARRASETNEIAQTKLKQAELSARELQTRLDATVREARSPIVSILLPLPPSPSSKRYVIPDSRRPRTPLQTAAPLLPPPSAPLPSCNRDPPGKTLRATQPASSWCPERKRCPRRAPRAAEVRQNSPSPVAASRFP